MTQRLFKILITLLFFFPLIAFAQKDEGRYYTGYIVNNSGDTIPGQLLKDTQYLRPEIISFRWNGEFQQFGQYDIRAFYIEELDLLFESHTITKNQDSNTLTPIEGELSGTELKDRHFLLTIARTRQAGVYAFLEENGQERLYYRNGDKIEELLVFKTVTYEGGVKIPQEKKRFRIQLLGYLIGCDNLQKKINSTRYNRKGLENLFLDYARCTGSEVVYRPKSSGVILSLGASIGVGTIVSTDQSKTVLGVGNSLMANAIHEGGGWFEGGLVLKAQPSRNSRFVYKGELKVRSQSIETVWSRPVPVTNLLSKVFYNYKNTNVMLNLLTDVQLTRWNGGLLFFEGGISLAKSLSGSTEISNGVFVGGSEFVFTDEKSDMSILQSDLAFIAGVGVNIRKLAVSIRYMRNLGDSIDEETGTAMTHGSLALNLAYMFK